MKRHTKVFIAFSLLILLIIVIKLSKEYYDLKELKAMIVQTESKSLASLVVAFRKTYQERFIEHHIAIDKKTVELLPVRTMGEISKNFSSLVGNKAIIRTVSDRPRNPMNKANNQEMKMIEYFNSNKEKKSYFESKENGIFYYSEPLYIKQGCLICHGKKEDALDIIKNNYTLAYDYKLGDLRGILSIQIDKSDIVEKVDINYFRGVKAGVLVYILFLGAIYIMIKIILKNQKTYEETLEVKVKEQVKELNYKDKKMFEQAKMAQMGELISMIAHQWRQPLGAIGSSVVSVQNKLSLGKYDLDDKAQREEFIKLLQSKFEDIAEYTEFLSKTIDDFRNFYKQNKEKEPVSLKDVIKDTLNIIQVPMENHNIKFNLEYDDITPINIYKNELMQVVLNILKNSEDNFKETDIKQKEVSIRVYGTNIYQVITIQDNGGGIPPNILPNIFEPYFSTKDERNGTGLGLYMSKIIVEDHHNGELLVKNIQDGIRFTILLPGDTK